MKVIIEYGLIEAEGIRFRDLYYNSLELQEARSSSILNRHFGAQMHVRLDDIRTITVETYLGQKITAKSMFAEGPPVSLKQWQQTLTALRSFEDRLSLPRTGGSAK